MPEEMLNMPKPPEEPGELLEIQNKEKKKLQKKARKWKVLTIFTGLIGIVAVVMLSVLYIDIQESKDYWHNQYYDKNKEVKDWESKWKEVEEQWAIIAKCGYIGENYVIEITDIGNGNGGVISDRDMIAENMYYMTIKFTVHLVDEDATWENPIYIDVIHPDGVIKSNPEKDNHCSKTDLSENTGTSEKRWFGWGNEKTGSLDPGLYVILFYEGDKIIQRQEVILK